MFLPQLRIYTIFLIFLLLHHLSFTTAISSPVSNKFTCFKDNKKADSFGETRAFGFDIVNLMIAVIVILNIIVHKLRQLQEAKYAEKDKLVLLSSGQTCRHFSLAEILWATNNFDDSCLIGKGGSAKVYKGTIDNGTTSVAIKRLILTSKQGGGSLFWTEIEMLSKFRHSNLVSLIGYCDEWHEMILVFEYIPRGTLSEHLHQSFEKGYYTLSWIQRLRICIGAARGLDYLHTGASIHQRVIHRDMKSTNILLDDNLEAKIADFGISKIVAINQGCTYVSTIVRGTFGYMDPSYFSTGRLTRKSDVYAFGVVLFEVLCGRKAVDLSRHDEQSGLAGWALHCISEGRVNEIIDSNLKMKISRNSLLAFVKIACQCLDRQPRCRPTMAEVVVVLEFALALQESPDSARIEEAITSDNSHSSTTMEVLYGSDQIKPFHHTRITFSRKIREILSAPIQVLFVQSNAKHSSYSRNKNSRVGNRWKLNKVGIVPAENDGMRMKNIGIVPEAKGIIATAKIKMFSLAELKSTTRDFSPDMMLAEGYYGRVYIGWLDEDTLSPSRIGIGMAVAIRRFNDVSEGFRAVQTEVDLCGKLYHPNFLKLLGFCSEGQEFLLVYEYMPKGTSERYMYRDNGKSLSWVVWLKILIGAAQYLAFLHSSEDHIIFCDFRPSNILLDGDFNTKICDSGRGICGPADGDTFVTYVSAKYCASSKCYLSPECKEAGCLSTKNDVYSFGVVLLEILTGMRVVDVKRKNKHNLIDKSRSVLVSEKKVKRIVNPKLLEHKYCPEGLHTILSDVPLLALKCLDLDPEKRPSMRQVLNTLEDIYAVVK